jgi:hypothetical protein
VRDPLGAERGIILTTIPAKALYEPLLFLPARELNNLGNIELPIWCDLPPHVRGGVTIMDEIWALFHYIFTIIHENLPS